MKKCYATLLLAALCSTATLAQQQDSLITQPAAGETINLYRTTTGYESVYYYAVDHQSTGDWQRLTSSSCHPRKISHPIFLNENAIFEQPLVWEYESAILLSFFRVTQGINQSVDYQTLISLLQKSDEVRKEAVWKDLFINIC